MTVIARSGATTQSRSEVRRGESSVWSRPPDSQGVLQRRPVAFEVRGLDTGNFGRFVPAPYADGVLGKGQSLEFGAFLGGEGADSKPWPAHRTRRKMLG